MKRKKLGVGIIGAGRISANHGIAYRCLSELCELIAVADIDEARSVGFRRTQGCRYAFTDYRKLLERDDVDLVSICTPPHLHKQIIIDALDAGKHILCEKPIARTLLEVDEILQAKQRNPQLKLSVVHQYRCDPTYLRVRDLVSDGCLGRMLMASVRIHVERSAAYYSSAPGRGTWLIDGGGVLINQSIHQLDLLVSLLGSPVEVFAYMRRFGELTEAEDTLVGVARFESDALATIECTVCAHDEWFAIELIGENAQTSIVAKPTSRRSLWAVESKSAAVKRALRLDGLRKHPDMPKGPKRNVVIAQKLISKLRSKSWLPPSHWEHTPYVRSFLECISLSRPSPVSVEEGRRSLELAVALYASAMTSGPITMPISKDCSFYMNVDPKQSVQESSSIGALRI